MDWAVSLSVVRLEVRSFSFAFGLETAGRGNV